MNTSFDDASYYYKPDDHFVTVVFEDSSEIAVISCHEALSIFQEQNRKLAKEVDYYDNAIDTLKDELDGFELREIALKMEIDLLRFKLEQAGRGGWLTRIWERIMR
jgi:hypothetical protein